MEYLGYVRVGSASGAIVKDYQTNQIIAAEPIVRLQSTRDVLGGRTKTYWKWPKGVPVPTARRLSGWRTGRKRSKRILGVPDFKY